MSALPKLFCFIAKSGFEHPELYAEVRKANDGEDGCIIEYSVFPDGGSITPFCAMLAHADRTAAEFAEEAKGRPVVVFFVQKKDPAFRHWITKVIRSYAKTAADNTAIFVVYSFEENRKPLQRSMLRRPDLNRKVHLLGGTAFEDLVRRLAASAHEARCTEPTRIVA